jgi:PleD family two-component response regulator
VAEVPTAPNLPGPTAVDPPRCLYATRPKLPVLRGWDPMSSSREVSGSHESREVQTDGMPFEGVPPEAQILIVDDEEPNVLLLERTLHQAGYANIRSTTDSRQVLPLFRELEPDLILLDLRMPNLDGFAVIKKLYDEVPDSVEVPILVLTADDTSETKRRALAAGARDFLTKPLDLPEVVARVGNLLEIRFLRLQTQVQRDAMRLLHELAQSSGTGKG